MLTETSICLSFFRKNPG